jgi:hypothetical protein
MQTRDMRERSPETDFGKNREVGGKKVAVATFALAITEPEPAHFPLFSGDLTMFASKKWLALGMVVVSLAMATESQAGNCRKTTYCYSKPVAKAAVPVVAAEVTTRVTVTTAVPQFVSVPQGSSLRVKVNFLGNDPGFVFLTAGELVLKCEILEWDPSYVVFRLPELGILSPKAVRLDITRPDGRVARSTDVLLVPTNDIEVIAPEGVEPRAPQKVSVNQPIANPGGLSIAQ